MSAILVILPEIPDTISGSICDWILQSASRESDEPIKSLKKRMKYPLGGNDYRTQSRVSSEPVLSNFLSKIDFNEVHLKVCSKLDSASRAVLISIVTISDASHSWAVYLRIKIVDDQSMLIMLF